MQCEATLMPKQSHAKVTRMTIIITKSNYYYVNTFLYLSLPVIHSHLMFLALEYFVIIVKCSRVAKTRWKSTVGVCVCVRIAWEIDEWEYVKFFPSMQIGTLCVNQINNWAHILAPQYSVCCRWCRSRSMCACSMFTLLIMTKSTRHFSKKIHSLALLITTKLVMGMLGDEEKWKAYEIHFFLCYTI